MKAFVGVLCVLAVLTWGGTSVLAQGKGKGGNDKTNVKQRDVKPNQGQDSPQAADANAPVRGKGGQGDKAAGARAKKAEPSTETVGKGKGGQGEKSAGARSKKQEQAAEGAGKGKGKGQQQQAQAFQKQLRHEEAKHMERQARLNRIRELAVKKGDAEMIGRVDKLIAKEQEVYGRKLQQLQGQSRALPPSPPKESDAARAPAGPNDAAGRKKAEVGAQKERLPADANELKKAMKEATPGQGKQKEKK